MFRLKEETGMSKSARDIVRNNVKENWHAARWSPP